MVRFHVQEKLRFRKMQYSRNSKWITKLKSRISSQASKPYIENEDQATNEKSVQWIFDPGGHLQNLRSYSVQDGEKLMQDRPMVPMGRQA